MNAELRERAAAIVGARHFELVEAANVVLELVMAIDVLEDRRLVLKSLVVDHEVSDDAHKNTKRTPHAAPSPTMQSLVDEAREHTPLRPLPDHDNHHNALACPYCNPKQFVLAYAGVPSEWKVKKEDL